MESELRADAPEFVPCFVGVAQISLPPPPPSRRKNRRRKTHRKKKKKSKDHFESADDKTKRKVDSSSAFNAETTIVAPTASPSPEDSTSFADVLLQPVSDGRIRDMTPVGWTVLRPKKQVRLPKEGDPKLAVVTEPKQTRARVDTARSPSINGMDRLRNRLWESMERLQHEKSLTNVASSRKTGKVASVCPCEEVHVATEPRVVASSCRNDKVHAGASSYDLPLRLDLTVNDNILLSKLENKQMPTSSKDIMQCLQLAVRMNRPSVVRLLCSQWNGSCGKRRKMKQQTRTAAIASGKLTDDHPLLIAVAMGHDQCLQILSSTFPVSAVTDDSGNTALHIAASRNNAEVFRLVYEQALLSTHVFKVLSSRNNRQETFLHVACLAAATDILDCVLRNQVGRNDTNYRMVQKLLLLVDARERTPLLTAISAGATDIVMNFLMQGVVGTMRPCPLRCAVQSPEPFDMVSLLLEFHGEKTDYDWRGALFDCLELRGRSGYLDLMRMLVEAGASPFANGNNVKKTEHCDSVLWCAVKNDDADAVVVLLDSYETVETRRRETRRRDPTLKQQPESFFAGMEDTADYEKRKCVQQCLVAGLFHLHESTDSEFNLTVLALYDRAVTLDWLHMSVLKESLRRSVLLPTDTSQCAVHKERKIRPVSTPHFENNGWSKVLPTLPWFHASNDLLCHFIDPTLDRRVNDAGPLITVRSIDGDVFFVHEDILDVKCAKLAGAVRFAKATRPGPEENCSIEVDVGLTARHCRWLFEHLYWGSMVSPLPEDPIECCETLLELILVADEYLCWTLLRECETRLLSSSESYRRCFCCRCLSSLYPQGHILSYESSLLVNEFTVLSILAVVNELCDTFPDTNEVYTLTVRTMFGQQSKLPLCSLRELAIERAIMKFGLIKSHRSWSSRLDSAEGDDAQTMCSSFLAFCLKHLAGV